MRNLGLLHQIAPVCGRNGCQRRMTEVKNPSFPTDGIQWRCPVHKGNKMSIREGSFFKRAHFKLSKGMLIVYCWALSYFFILLIQSIVFTSGIPIHTQIHMTCLQKKALIDWNNFLREICSSWLIDHPIRY